IEESKCESTTRSARDSEEKDTVSSCGVQTLLNHSLMTVFNVKGSASQLNCKHMSHDTSAMRTQKIKHNYLPITIKVDFRHYSAIINFPAVNLNLCNTGLLVSYRSRSINHYHHFW
ncbi:hypothetical protein BLOT_000450, partial [Blomia tropicalis]